MTLLYIPVDSNDIGSITRGIRTLEELRDEARELKIKGGDN